jgi:hypothetical protein
MEPALAQCFTLVLFRELFLFKSENIRHYYILADDAVHVYKSLQLLTFFVAVISIIQSFLKIWKLKKSPAAAGLFLFPRPSC